MIHKHIGSSILIMFILTIPASATISISNPNMQFHTSGGATINFSDNTTLDALQWGGTYLNATVNGSKVGFSGSALNTLLSHLIYQASPENLSFSAVATSGTLNIDTNMTYANVTYAMYVNGIKYRSEISDSYGASKFNYSTWGSEKGIYFTPLPPEITSYNNSITQNDYTYPHQDSNGNIIFNTTADSPVTNWTWYVDGEAVPNNYDNFTHSWSGPGQKNVTVSGSNAAGATAQLSWYPIIERSKSDSTDETEALNTSWYDDLVDSFNNETPSVSDFAGAMALPFTSLLGNFFYLFLYGLPLLVIWIRQEKALIPAGLGIIFGAFFLGQLPESYVGAAVLFMILTVFGIIYSLYKERG